MSMTIYLMLFNQGNALTTEAVLEGLESRPEIKEPATNIGTTAGPGLQGFEEDE